MGFAQELKDVSEKASAEKAGVEPSPQCSTGRKSPSWSIGMKISAFFPLSQ
jgi:hypothetical protein